MFTLRATIGPPDVTIQELYREVPVQKDYLVKVKHPESAQRLMAIGYELVEDYNGQIDPSKQPLSPDDVANSLGIAKSTVYKYLSNGTLKGLKDESSVPPRWKIPRAAVEEFKASLAEA